MSAAKAGLSEGNVIVHCNRRLAVLATAVALVLGAGCNQPKKKTPDKTAHDDKTSRDENAVEVKRPARRNDDGPRPKAELTRAKQLQVNKAVEAALKYLKEHQGPDGRWHFRQDIRSDYKGRFPVGLAALPGLTLLECGVKKDDPGIVKAAEFVRNHCATLDQTYEISLAILFLDRLGNPADEALIRTLALRLVAGQTDNGGWSYRCPLIQPEDEKLLTSALASLPLTNKLTLIEDPKKPDPANKLTLTAPPGPNEDRPDATKLTLLEQQPPRPKLQAIETLPARLKKLPVLQVKVETAGTRAPQRSDNSNTQFATLALWAARRHELPLDRTLALVVKRFRTSQYITGGWGYGYTYMVGVKSRWIGKNTMACAGLLGLAVGHGLAQSIKSPEALSDKDRAVDRALRALGTGLGDPFKERASGKWRYNMYLLWSVERVGMLYNLKKIGKVDWYNWGVNILLKHQAKDGSWSGGLYTGADPTTDTCFGLLFLKRVNLAPDLSGKLNLDVSGAD